MLVEYGADVDAKAKKRDICNGAFLTCDQLAQEVGFVNYEQVKNAALAKKTADALLAKLKRAAGKDKEERIKEEIAANVGQNTRSLEEESRSQSLQGRTADRQKRNEEIKENIGTNMKTSSAAPEPEKVENTTNDAKKEEPGEGDLM